MITLGFAIFKETKHFMSNKNIVRNLTTFYKGTLVRRNDLRENNLQSISHCFRDYFIEDIALASGSKLVNGLRDFYFEDKS